MNSFTERNFLKLNMDELEILEMTNGSHLRLAPIHIGTDVLKPSSSVRCLGVVWSNTLPKNLLLTTSARHIEPSLPQVFPSTSSPPARSLRYALSLWMRKLAAH